MDRAENHTRPLGLRPDLLEVVRCAVLDVLSPLPRLPRSDGCTDQRLPFLHIAGDLPRSDGLTIDR